MGGLTSSINCLEVSSKHTTGHSGSRSSWYRSRTSSIRATNSPLTLGMHHSLFFHGLSSFFLVSGGWSQGRALCKLHRHHLVGKQLQRPVGVSFGSVAARDGDEVRLLSAIQLSSPPRSRSVVDCSVQPLRNEPCAHSTDGTGAEVKPLQLPHGLTVLGQLSTAQAPALPCGLTTCLATSIRSDRSDSVNSLYLMAGRHGLTKGLCTSLINFSYYINTLWNRY